MSEEPQITLDDVIDILRFMTASPAARSGRNDTVILLKVPNEVLAEVREIISFRFGDVMEVLTSPRMPIGDVESVENLVRCCVPPSEYVLTVRAYRAMPSFRPTICVTSQVEMDELALPAPIYNKLVHLTAA